MTYISKQCYSKPISIISQTESLFKHDKITANHDELKRQNFNIKKKLTSVQGFFMGRKCANLAISIHGSAIIRAAIRDCKYTPIHYAIRPAYSASGVFVCS